MCLKVASKIMNDKLSSSAHLLRTLGFETPYHEEIVFESFKHLTDTNAESSHFYFGKLGKWINSKTKFIIKSRKGDPNTNQYGKDIVNCSFNLGYALLENTCRLAINGVGLMTDIGFIHETRSPKESLVFDTMENFRSTVDRAILSLLETNAVSQREFIYKRRDYVFRLNYKAERIVIRSVMNTLRLNDITKYIQSIARLCDVLSVEN